MPSLSWRKVGQAAGSGSAWVGLIEVPAMVVPERYLTEARVIWPRAIAASAHYGLLVVVCPNAAARRHLLLAIPPLAARAWIGHPTDPERYVGQRKGTSLPIMARSANGLGAILLSTPISLLRDLTMWPGPRWRKPGLDRSASGRRSRRLRAQLAPIDSAHRWSDGEKWPD